MHFMVNVQYIRHLTLLAIINLYQIGYLLGGIYYWLLYGEYSYNGFGSWPILGTKVSISRPLLLQF